MIEISLSSLLVVATVLFIPIGILFLECVAALLPPDTESLPSNLKRPRLAVLVPAHNEAAGIQATLETLLPQLVEGDRLVVIADNCTDDTAEVAQRFGATVIERQDSTLRGKGYALDYGLRFLDADPPEVLVSVDADCLVESGTVQKIACLAAANGQPVQGTYLMIQPEHPTPKDAISMLAIKVKNLVRPRGLTKLGSPCLLTGSGMAFPWTVIRSVSLANSKTVDDMQLSIDLAIAGHPPTYCQETRITGRLMQESAAKSQRARWEHGHLETLLTQVPRLIGEAANQRRFDLLTMALDLCIPPLSLLATLWGAIAVIALVAGFLTKVWTPAAILALEGFLLTFSTVGAWVRFGRQEIPGRVLLSIPLYILWKIPLYLAFLVRPQTRWLRTERDA